ncbi:MAG: RNA methyltransferase [Bacteroidota bacterium]
MLGKQKVKYIQSLGQKKFREQEGSFIAEGPKIVLELLGSAKKNIRQVYAVKEWIEENNSILENIEAIEIESFELDKISQLATPHKVLAIVKQFEIPKDIITSKKITLALDTIQDPGNLGTIIRIADWFSIDQIVCSNNCADVYNSKVVQSTMGSIARVKVFYTELEEWLEKQKVRIYAATLEGKDISTIKKLDEGIIVIGNESKGISSEILSRVNVKISIPQKGRAESLNAAVATGIILSHII